MAESKKISIYVLLLENDKKYVGKTKRYVLDRIIEYRKNIRSSAWIDKYQVIDIIQVYHDCDDFDEDKITIKMMEKYGIDNVRGGSFCKMVLSGNDKNIINKMITGATDKCYKCSGNHFTKNCDTKAKPNIGKKKLCERCGRKNHSEKDCYATFDMNGDEIIECERCGRKNHSEKDCYATFDMNGDEIIECGRCGRDTHTEENCYASKDIDGNYI